MLPSRFFSVTLRGVKLFKFDIGKMQNDVLGLSEPMEPWMEKTKNPSMMKDVPQEVYKTVCIECEDGKFVPSKLIDYLKREFDLVDVALVFTQEITEAEYKAERAYIEKPTKHTLEEVNRLFDILEGRITDDEKRPKEDIPKSKTIDDELNDIFGIDSLDD